MKDHPCDDERSINEDVMDESPKKAVQVDASQDGFEAQAEESRHASGMRPVARIADEDVESEGCEKEGWSTHSACEVFEDGLEVEVSGEEVGHSVVNSFFLKTPWCGVYE